MWMTSVVKNAAAVPVFFDSIFANVAMYDERKLPPEYDAIPTRDLRPEHFSYDSLCINRHEGNINSLFMDWSVRKVGLKELWTLKWNPQYNTMGPWTKRGGCDLKTGPSGCGTSRITECSRLNAAGVSGVQANMIRMASPEGKHVAQGRRLREICSDDP
jgi:hypothetical protein